MKIALIFLFIIVSSIISFISGARIGANEFSYWNAQYQASILVYEIQALKNHKSEELVEAKEIMLNGELANHGRYLNSSLNWFWTGYPRDDEPIKRVVDYRLRNPYKDPDVTDTTKWNTDVDLDSQETQEFLKQLEEGTIIQEQLIKLVLETYGIEN